ncbi:MAG: sugar phosphate nucleotidyltransferase [Promethearchaeota archaeon]|jgi:NDP-sugar pyrophosphorylase family protein
MTRGIIISGGWGTRLRPLTCTIPKPLIPIVNKPVLERQILLLKAAGITDIILAVSVMGDILKNYFGDGSNLGVNIQYTDERSPMGTAGAIKLAEDYLNDDNFFMLNGDVILNFDFKQLLEAHEKNKGIGLIGGKIVKDPSRYGVLIIEEPSNKILKFLEKDEYTPPGDEYIPMPINAGVYLLEPEIFNHIEPGKKVSIERDVFPKLALEGELYYHHIPGVWKDIGKPEELLEGNIQFMEELLQDSNKSTKNLIGDKLDIEGKALFYSPVTIGDNVTIRSNCEIGPNVIIGNNVYIGENTKIKETLIYNETYISNNVDIEKAIVSDNCIIQDGVKLKGNNQNLVILASYVQVSKDVRMNAPSNNSLTVCHHETVRQDFEVS